MTKKLRKAKGPPSSFDSWIATRIPSATYRLQFNKEFKFADAQALLPYLERLGVSDCYASPILKARRGSTHGYDVTDHSTLNPEIGSPTEFDRFARGLKKRKMGLLLDIVPNHMAMSDQNRVFMDVLENGRDSKYSGYFDIVWDSHGDKLILPVLGSDLESAIKEHNVSLGSDGELHVYDSKLPLSSKSRKEEQKVDLPSLLSEQHYKLQYWKTGARKINYRRFSTVTDLIAIRVEDPSVYRESHALILDLVRSGKVTGLRIDHVDGLYEPRKYLSLLQRDCVAALNGADPKSSSFYVVVEKILGKGERLPSDWPVQGTTGYEFLNDLNAIYVDQSNSRAFDLIYSRFTHIKSSSYEEIVGASRRKIIDTSMESDLSRLAKLALGILKGEKLEGHSPTARYIKAGLREVAACFPVYRTYVDEGPPRGQDRRYIEVALGRAKNSVKGRKKILEAIDKLGRVLLSDDSTRNKKSEDFVKRFQQFTAPISAKGVEDTAFYVYNRLLSLNEVGGDPGAFGSSIEDFHLKNAERFRSHPLSILTMSTHDTKRSADTRSRINVLSEMPQKWSGYLERWGRMNAERRIMVGGKRCPSANDEYNLYQSMLGIWPSEKSLTKKQKERTTERIESFMVKAIREEKRETSWLDPNKAYEDGVKNFVRGILGSESFLSSFEELLETVSYHGMLNSLSQLLLHMTCPGVPDVYQGSEIWDYSLVDPDNRRVVDYKRRIMMLSHLEDREKKEGTDELLRLLSGKKMMDSGFVKMYVLNKLLKFRGLHRDLFQKGDYLPLGVEGARSRHVCAFARRYGGDEIIVVAPRFFVSLLSGPRYELAGDVWKDTRIVLNRDKALSQSYSDIFTRRTVTVRTILERQTLLASGVLGRFPVALLSRDGSSR